MKEYNVNTAEQYDDLVGYVSDDNLPNNNLAEMLDMEEEYKPKVKPKAVDPEFPEQWQSLYVSFRCLEDYAKFMKEIGMAPSPKLREFVYDPHDNEQNLSKFF